MISQGEVFTYRVTTDHRGNYLQMFRPQTTKMLKSLLISHEQLPEAPAGEAWIETIGAEVVCCIPLKEGLITGRVVEVSEQFYTIEVDGRQGRFPLQWATAPQTICIYSEAIVDAKKQQLYTASGGCFPPPQPLQMQTACIAALPQLPQSQLSPRQVGIEITKAMKADFHRPSEENFEVPKTIGRHRQPIDILQGEFHWNSVIKQKFQTLSQSYSVCRTIRGDGNSFYRCLGVLLLEHYCRPDTPLQEFYTVYSEIIQQNRHFNLSLANRSDLGMLKQFIKLFKDLYTLRSKGENAFQHLQYCLQCPNIDKAMIVAMRQYTASYLQQNYQHPDIAPFLENANVLLSEINEYGREAEGLTLWLAARCFSVVLHSVIRGNTADTVHGPETQGWYPSFSLLNLPGRYYCLIRREVHEADHYDFASNTYTPIPTGQIVGYELFPQ